jgi:hypothetical protein
MLTTPLLLCVCVLTLTLTLVPFAAANDCSPIIPWVGAPTSSSLSSLPPLTQDSGGDAAVLLALCELNPQAPVCDNWLAAAAVGVGPCGHTMAPGWDRVDCAGGRWDTNTTVASTTGDGTRVTALHLSSQQITVLPPMFPELTALCFLNLRHNNLVKLTREVTSMQLSCSRKRGDGTRALDLPPAERNTHELLVGNDELLEYPYAGFLRPCVAGYYLVGDVCTMCACFYEAKSFDPCDDTIPPDTGDMSLSGDVPCNAESSVFLAYCGAVVFIVGVASLGYIVWLLTFYEWTPDVDSAGGACGSAHAQTRHANSQAAAAKVDAAKNAHELTHQFKIVWQQLQLSFVGLSLNWNWPNFMTWFRRYFSWIQLDSAAVVPLACVFSTDMKPNSMVDSPGSIDPGGLSGERQKFLVVSYFSVAVLLIVVAFRVKFGLAAKTSASAARNVAHITNFLWASYTLLGPLVWASAIGIFLAKGDDHLFTAGADEIAVVLGIPFVFVGVALPALALTLMLKAKTHGTLQAPQSEARYGWLCADHNPNCFWWEIMTLEVRLLVMFSVTLSAAASQALISAVALSLLGLQWIFKPFRETSEEANHWTSPNNQALLASVVVVFVMLVGVICTLSELTPGSGVATAIGLLTMAVLLIPSGATIAIVRAPRTPTIAAMLRTDCHMHVM